MYGDTTNSYPLNLPADYYHNYMKKEIEKEKVDDDKWFIRPHHIESLSGHPNSIRDDVLNTHYFSHIEQSYGKEPEVNESELAISEIEKMLTTLRNRQEHMYRQRGVKWDYEDYDNLAYKLRDEGQRKFDE